MFRGTKTERDALLSALGCRADVLKRRVAWLVSVGNDKSAQRHTDELALVQTMRAGLKGEVGRGTS